MSDDPRKLFRLPRANGTPPAIESIHDFVQHIHDSVYNPSVDKEGIVHLTVGRELKPDAWRSAPPTAYEHTRYHQNEPFDPQFCGEAQAVNFWLRAEALEGKSEERLRREAEQFASNLSEILGIRPLHAKVFFPPSTDLEYFVKPTCAGVVLATTAENKAAIKDLIQTIMFERNSARQPKKCALPSLPAPRPQITKVSAPDLEKLFSPQIPHPQREEMAMRDVLVHAADSEPFDDGYIHADGSLHISVEKGRARSLGLEEGDTTIEIDDELLMASPHLHHSVPLVIWLKRQFTVPASENETEEHKAKITRSIRGLCETLSERHGIPLSASLIASFDELATANAPIASALVLATKPEFDEILQNAVRDDLLEQFDLRYEPVIPEDEHDRKAPPPPGSGRY